MKLERIVKSVLLAAVSYMPLGCNNNGSNSQRNETPPPHNDNYNPPPPENNNDNNNPPPPPPKDDLKNAFENLLNHRDQAASYVNPLMREVNQAAYEASNVSSFITSTQNKFRSLIDTSQKLENLMFASQVLSENWFSKDSIMHKHAPYNTVVIYVNGAGNTIDNFIVARSALEMALDDAGVLNAQTAVHGFYYYSHANACPEGWLSGPICRFAETIGDLVEATPEVFRDMPSPEIWTTALRERLKFYIGDGQKVVLVTQSRGNLLARDALFGINTIDGVFSDPKDSIGVVMTGGPIPASDMPIDANQIYRVSICGDPIDMIGDFSFNLSNCVDNPELGVSVPPENHYFINSYIKGQNSRREIVQGVRSLIDIIDFPNLDNGSGGTVRTVKINLDSALDPYRLPNERVDLRGDELTSFGILLEDGFSPSQENVIDARENKTEPGLMNPYRIRFIDGKVTRVKVTLWDGSGGAQEHRLSAYVDPYLIWDEDFFSENGSGGTFELEVSSDDYGIESVVLEENPSGYELLSDLEYDVKEYTGDDPPPTGNPYVDNIGLFDDAIDSNLGIGAPDGQYAILRTDNRDAKEVRYVFTDNVPRDGSGDDIVVHFGHYIAQEEFELRISFRSSSPGYDDVLKSYTVSDIEGRNQIGLDINGVTIGTNNEVAIAIRDLTSSPSEFSIDAIESKYNE